MAFVSYDEWTRNSSGILVRPGRSRPSVAGPSPTDRDDLVYGDYKPNNSDVTGPKIPVSQMTVIGTPSTQRDVNATSNGQVFKGLYVWGNINFGNYSNCRVEDCHVRGGLLRSGSLAFIMGGGDNLRGAEIIDCKLQGRPVATPPTYTRNGVVYPVGTYPRTDTGNTWIQAMRGGNYSIRRTEITRTADGIGLTSQLGNVQIEGCWIHQHCYGDWDPTDGSVDYFLPEDYVNGVSGTLKPGAVRRTNWNGYYTPAALGSQYTHCDGIQFNRGANYLIRGNYIGGRRNGLFDHNAGKWAEISAGDDFYNAGILLKQEQTNLPGDKIENTLIEKNWFEGGITQFSHAAELDPNHIRYNAMETVTIRNNRHVRDNPAFSPAYIRTPMTAAPGAGGVPKFGNYYGNVMDDTGLPVVLTRG